MKQAAYDLRYLVACAMNRIAPEKERVEAMNLENVRRVSRSLSLSALAATAVAASGVELSAEWREEKERAVRRSILFDGERAGILAYLEESGIWYLPMKGILLKDLYPGLGLREMADNDILFDSTRQSDVVAFMKQRGYEVGSVGKGAHDTYYKPPVFNFELHTQMFSDVTSETFCRYYANVKDRLLPVEGKKYAYRMTDEDYYIHMTAHEYKHYIHSGTGLRSLLDRYAYLKSKGGQLDLAYVERECRALGIDRFERDSRALCQRVFSTAELPPLTDSEREMLEYYMFSTTYGTMSQGIRHQIEQTYGAVGRGSRLRYVLRRAFPKAEFYKTYAPVAYRYRILIPFVCIGRLFKGMFTGGKRIRRELGALHHLK